MFETTLTCWHRRHGKKFNMEYPLSSFLGIIFLWMHAFERSFRFFFESNMFEETLDVGISTLQASKE